MNTITADFETYYSKEYSLSKMSTEAYVKDPAFEVICVAVKVNDGKTRCYTGDMTGTADWLSQFDWGNSILVCQNTAFDGAILRWHFGIRAAGYVDTMLMSYAIDGPYKPASLKALAERWLEDREKGTEVINALGKQRKYFRMEDMLRYKQYCVNDVDLTYDIFREMLAWGFPKKELKLMDVTLRMFIEPMLKLDKALLVEHLQEIRDKKAALMDRIDANRETLMSNPKFADALREVGVEPPMKVSKTTGKETYAFAKSDEGFRALQEHENEDVQALVAARLGVKSTLAETRTERFIDMAGRGLFPVPLKYCGTLTHRWSGADSVNLQNLPSRGNGVNALKRSIMARKGHTLIEADSSQIEARVLAWLAGQEDLVETFRQNNAEIAAGIPKEQFQHDPYKLMASAIYDIDPSEVDKAKRDLGKATLLGAGYGMGHVRFTDELKKLGMGDDESLAKHIINVYRTTNHRIPQLWKAGQLMIECLYKGEEFDIGAHVGTIPGVAVAVPGVGVRMPSGLYMRYENLKASQVNGRWEYSYMQRREVKRLYGPKMIENICQSLARCIIGEQILKISKHYRVVLTVHDSVLVAVPDDEVQEAQDFVMQCMRWTPEWAKGLPLNCEAGYAKRYGDC